MASLSDPVEALRPRPLLIASSVFQSRLTNDSALVHQIEIKYSVSVVEISMCSTNCRVLIESYEHLQYLNSDLVSSVSRTRSGDAFGQVRGSRRQRTPQCGSIYHSGFPRMNQSSYPPVQANSVELCHFLAMHGATNEDTPCNLLPSFSSGCPPKRPTRKTR